MADSPAKIDSVRLEKFRQDLERHRSMTGSGLDRIQNSVSRLSDRWKDEQFKRFRQSLERTSDRLKQFLDTTGKQVSHLEELVRASRDVERGDVRIDQ